MRGSNGRPTEAGRRSDGEEWVGDAQQRVLQIEEGALAAAGTPCGVQGCRQERAGTTGPRSVVAKLSSAHLRARHTPRAASEMAGALGYSFLVGRGWRLTTTAGVGDAV